MLSEYTSQSTVNIIIHALLSSIKSAVKWYLVSQHITLALFFSVICVQRGEREEREELQEWSHHSDASSMVMLKCKSEKKCVRER